MIRIDVNHVDGRSATYYSKVIPTIGSWIEVWSGSVELGNAKNLIMGRVYDVTYNCEKRNYDWSKDDWLEHETYVTLFLKGGKSPSRNP